MRVDAFDYELPQERIAQRPASDRESARLLVVRPDGALVHRTVADLPELLPPRALVVLNDTRVVPARLLGQKADTGGKVEIFLVRKVDTREVEGRNLEIWRAMGKASKALRFGTDVVFGNLRGHLLGRAEDDDGLL